MFKKILGLSLLLMLSTTGYCQWRSVKISSKNYTGDIEENFRRSSLWSNRKLDRFGSDTVYGQPVFHNGIKFGDGTIQNTAIVTESSATYTGSNTFTATGTGSTSISSLTVTGSSMFSSATSTTTFLGYIDIGIVVISSVTTAGPTTIKATCPVGKYILTGSCYSTDGDLRMCGAAISPATWPWTSWTAITTGTGYKEVIAICARVK